MDGTPHRYSPEGRKTNKTRTITYRKEKETKTFTDKWTHPDVYDSGDWDANYTWRRSIVADDKRNAATLYPCLGGPACWEKCLKEDYIDELSLKMFATAWT